MKQCCEFVHELYYKLYMMGIIVNKPTFIRGDNKSVLCHTIIPLLVLSKKLNSIAYTLSTRELQRVNGLPDT